MSINRLRNYGGYVRFWTASTVSDFGTYITTLALQVLVVLTLHGSATEVGLINAGRWLPYVQGRRSNAAKPGHTRRLRIGHYCASCDAS